MKPTVGSDFEMAFFNDMMSELGLKSMSGVIGVTKKVFQSLQQNLPVNEVKFLLMKLPEYLQMLWQGEWKTTNHPSAYDHLDQWVESIMHEDELSSNRIFHSQLDVLRALVVTLNKLDKLCGLFTFHGFKFSLIQEIKSASTY